MQNSNSRKTSGLHPFNVTPKQAVQIQRQLRDKVIRKGEARHVRHAAGVDVSFRNGQATGAVAVIRLPNLELISHAISHRPIEFPYVPGLLSFREIPVILDALEKVDTTPDVILCDGQGIAHPRRLGIASHLGVITGIRTIGAAKSRLIGVHDEVSANKAEWAALLDDGETIGAVLRTRSGVKPVYVSIGHRVDLESAIDVVMRCTSRFRLPEPTRWAHRLAGPNGAAKIASK